MKDYQSKEVKSRVLLGAFKRKAPCTTNDAISYLFKEDIENKDSYILLEQGWRYYVHLNKHTAYLERKGLIKHIGYKTGNTKRQEKVWAVR